MKYSNQIINGIKELFPDQKEMIELAEQGDPYLLLYLKNSWKEINHKDILSASSLDELKEKALLIQKKEELYNLCISENYN